MRVLAAFSLSAVLLVWAAPAALAQGSAATGVAAKPAATKPVAARPKVAAKPKATAKPKPAATAPAPAESKPAAAAAGGNNAPAATGAVARKATAARKQNLRGPYEAIPLAERVAIQSDLTWTGDYNGLINGEFSDRLVAAVKAFQKRLGKKDTGLLDPEERTRLAAAAKPRQQEVGWQLIEDTATGIYLGVPGKLASRSMPVQAGTRWTSAQGQLQIETFRVTGGATLEAVFGQQKSEPLTRKVSYSVLRPDYFVVSGMQGLKKLYVRAAAKGGEVRGMTVLYDQAMEGTMDPVVIAMSSAFAPFGNVAGAVPPIAAPRRKVEYATGVVVSAAGHIVTDRQAIEGCQVIVIPGLGHAERLAETDDVALVRIHGARNLAPLPLTEAAAAATSATLVGIADPQAQGGGATISTVAVRVAAAGNQRSLEPPPAPGFAGAAVLDPQGRFVGMVVQKTPVVAGPASAAQASLVPADALIKLLEANHVAPASGRPGVDAAKASVVRVICVRK